MDFIIAQIIGGFALLLSIISFQQKNRSKILLVQIFSTIFYSLHFFLLTAFTGAAMNLITVFRSYVFYHKDNKKWASKKNWFWLFMILVWIGGIVTWRSVYSIFPILALTFGTIAYWQTNPKYVRAISVLSRPLWIIYSIYYLSIPGIIVELLIGTSTIIGIIRLDIKKSTPKLYATDLFHKLLGFLRFRT